MRTMKFVKNSQPEYLGGEYYCPDCNAQVHGDAQSCELCAADFGPASTWKPIAGSIKKKSPAYPDEPIFPRQSKSIHSLQSIVLFTILGPMFGLIIMEILARSYSSPGTHGLPMLGRIIFAFILAAPLALTSGAMYCIVAMAAVVAFPRLTVGTLGGATIGAVVGFCVTLGSFVLFRNVNVSDVLSALPRTLLVGPGLLCGLLSGWLLPVGRKSSRPLT